MLSWFISGPQRILDALAPEPEATGWPPGRTSHSQSRCGATMPPLCARIYSRAATLIQATLCSDSWACSRAESIFTYEPPAVRSRPATRLMCASVTKDAPPARMRPLRTHPSAFILLKCSTSKRQLRAHMQDEKGWESFTRTPALCLPACMPNALTSGHQTSIANRRRWQRLWIMRVRSHVRED